MADERLKLALEKERKILQSKLLLIEQTLQLYSENPAQGLYNRIFNIRENKYKLQKSDETLGEILITEKDRINYQQLRTYKEKAIFILRFKNRFLHINEIARIMECFESGVSYELFKSNVVAALSLLRNRKPQSKVTYIRIGGSHFHTFWGFTDWLDNDGTVLEPYKFQDSYFGKGPIE